MQGLASVDCTNFTDMQLKRLDYHIGALVDRFRISRQEGPDDSFLEIH